MGWRREGYNFQPPSSACSIFPQILSVRVQKVRTRLKYDVSQPHFLGSFQTYWAETEREFYNMTLLVQYTSWKDLLLEHSK